MTETPTIVPPADKKTILLYGRTNSGKTVQCGELAKHIKITTGLDTLIYSIDKGKYDVLKPHINIGFVTVIEQGDTNPWLFLSKAAQGLTRDDKGKWVKQDLSKYGLIVFEGLTAFADALMNDLADQAAGGMNIGGSASVAFKVQGDGEVMSVGGNNMSHYNVVQTRITKEVWNSQKLPVPYIMWTASVSKDDDQVNSGKVLGPAVVGKALTSEVPRWFQYTFRIDTIPAAQGRGEEHVLYLGTSIDQAAGNAVSLGNIRLPLGGGAVEPTIKPASIVEALTRIEKASSSAEAAMRAEMARLSKVKVGS